MTIKEAQNFRWIKGNTFVSSEIREMKDNLHMTSYVCRQMTSCLIMLSETYKHALPLF